MTKFITKLDFSIFRDSTSFLSKRLIYWHYVDVRSAEFDSTVKDKISSGVEKRAQVLKSQNKTPEEVDAELLKETNRLYKQITEDLLATKKNPFDKKAVGDFLKEKEKYFKEYLVKTIESYKKRREFIQEESKRLRQLTKEELDQANPEQEKMDEYKTRRQAEKEKSKEEREEMLEDASGQYLRVVGMVNTMTLTSNKEDNAIKRYEIEKGQSYADNPLRSRLNGYLYASYVFFGGKEAGQTAVRTRFAEASKYAHKSFPTRNRFTRDDLENKMSLKPYFNKVEEKYTKNPEAVGMMAGLLKLCDENIHEGYKNRKYQDYLSHHFERIKSLSPQEQIQQLFMLKSQIELNPDWKNALRTIDGLTDPKSAGAKITDYPGIWGANKDNPTRHQLTGYIFAEYLFARKADKSTIIDSTYERASHMHKRKTFSSFEQKDLEQDFVDGDKNKPGFGLGGYLMQANDAYRIKDDKVKGVVAGLLKLGREKLSAEQSKPYLNYLDINFAKLSTLSPENQLMALGAVKSPEEFFQEKEENHQEKIFTLLADVVKQHPQFKFNDPDIQKFLSGKSVFNLQEVTDKARQEIDFFINTRADLAVNEKIDEKDNPEGIFFKLKQLEEKNKKLAKPLYNNLDDLKKTAQDIKKKFELAKRVSRVNDLDRVISGKYLESLLEAERDYVDFNKEIKEKTAAVDQAEKKPDAPTPITAGAATGPGVVPPTGQEKEKKSDHAWENAKEVEPAMKDYTGTLIVKAARLNGRDADGKIVTTFPKGTELFRTADDEDLKGKEVKGVIYVRVTHERETYWVAEKHLEIPKAETPAPVVKKPAEKTPETVEQVPANTTYEIPYNQSILSVTIQKMPDGYHLVYKTPDGSMLMSRMPEINGKQVFKTLPEAKYYIERGDLLRNLNLQILVDPEAWKRYEKRIGKLVNIDKSGFSNVRVEMKWLGEKFFADNNLKCSLEVGSDGRINYRMDKAHVGPNGENVRTGSVTDFYQLVEVLEYSKVWAEHYPYQKYEQPLPIYQRGREQQLLNMMNLDSYKSVAGRIGEVYNFQNFQAQGYANMRLNWYPQNNPFSPDSVQNPQLEVKINSDNTVTYNLTNQANLNSTKVGYTGLVGSLEEVFKVVEAAKKDPAKYLKTPLSQLPTLAEYHY